MPSIINLHTTPSDVKVFNHSITRRIWVTFTKVGFHCYPQAPDEVAYLKSPHRHLFKFKVTVDVEHDDREIEFHMFLNWCLSQYADAPASGVDTQGLALNNASCEMIAEALANKIADTYGNHRRIEVEVSEDGECGAVIVRTPV